LSLEHSACPDALQREHNETLAKLNFVLALSDCVMELAQARATPLAALTESTSGRQQTEGCRRAEQLVLLVRALQLLSSGLSLASQQLRAGQLQPSASVKSGKCSVPRGASLVKVLQQLIK
jgi:serine/threonine-protein kinase ULK/ATG1